MEWFRTKIWCSFKKTSIICLSEIVISWSIDLMFSERWQTLNWKLILLQERKWETQQYEWWSGWSWEYFLDLVLKDDIDEVFFCEMSSIIQSHLTSLNLLKVNRNFAINNISIKPQQTSKKKKIKIKKIKK